MLLLYAQPLTRIAQLGTGDITTADGGEVALTFARGAIVLPEPLASIALALRYQRVADGEHDGWLLPGRKRGTHITAEHLRKRLAPHGITSRPGRHGAQLALAGRLPAPILAERLGIHQARAAQWTRAAGATYLHRRQDDRQLSGQPLRRAAGERGSAHSSLPRPPPAPRSCRRGGASRAQSAR